MLLDVSVSWHEGSDGEWAQQSGARSEHKILDAHGAADIVNAASVVVVNDV